MILGVRGCRSLGVNQKSIQEGSWGCPGGSWGVLGAKTEQGHEVSVFWGHLGAVMGASWARLGAWIAVVGRLGAVWGRLRIDIKIDQKIEAFRDRVLIRFCWILGRKMEASWHQIRNLSRCCL